MRTYAKMLPLAVAATHGRPVIDVPRWYHRFIIPLEFEIFPMGIKSIFETIDTVSMVYYTGW